MSAVVKTPNKITEPTGGRTRAGYDSLVRVLKADASSDAAAYEEISQKLINFPQTVQIKQLAEATVDVIELLLLPDRKERLEFYLSLIDLLKQKLSQYQQSQVQDNTSVEFAPKEKTENYFDRHESPIITNAFLKMMKNTSTFPEKRTAIYADDEDTDRF